MVAEALQAFDSGRGSIVPGRVIRWFVRINKPAPMSLTLRAVERMYRPQR